MSEGEGSADHVVKVVVVDDDALVRAALTLMLDGIDGLRVVGEAADGADVAAVVDRHAPHVVLMDLRMPQVDGVTATRRLRARPNAPEVVVLTTFDADSDVLRRLARRSQRVPAEGHPTAADRRGDPSSVDVPVHSSAGAVRSDGLSGDVDLSTSAGSVRATSLSSSDVRASSSARSVTVELASEPRVSRPRRARGR